MNSKSKIKNAKWTRPSTAFSSFFIFHFSFFIVAAAFGAQFQVTTPAEIADAAAQARPGDTIVMQDGVWQDADILFSANGTNGNPITLRAQTLGLAQLSGQSRLRIAGNFLVVDGLVFTNGFRTSGDIIAFQDATPANNCRLTNCAVLDYNPPNLTNDTKWVSLYGLSNRVENCYFKGKANVGTMMVVWVDTNRPNYHVIARNYFGPRPVLTAASNGGETVRIGTSDVSMGNSRTTVENNFFEQCNGDAEIVSSKSSENIYRHNTFVDCEGSLCLRHGNRSVVEGNYFFGHSRDKTGGVRIVGEDHKVYNNYFQDLAGTSSRAPMAIMQGLVDSPLSGYFQVQRATVAFNTFVNCSTPLVIGLSGTLSGTTNVTTLPPVDCAIANNIVLQFTGKIVDQKITPVNLLWEGNFLSGATLNIPTNLGTLRIDPQLVFGPDGLWRPNTNSPTLGAAQGTYNFVTNDFEGQARPATKDVGCDQASLDPAPYPALAATDVGPLWLRLRGTFLNWPPPAEITYGTRLGPAQLNASANAAGTMVFTPPPNTRLNAGTGQVLTVVFTPQDTVNFSAVTQSVTINVAKATPTILWTNPAPIVYGTRLESDQCNATALWSEGNVPGSFSYTPRPGSLLSVSNGQTLSVTFTPFDLDNFWSASRSVTIDVARATPRILWAEPAPVEQGTALSSLQLNATANTPGRFVYDPPLGTMLTAGSGHRLSVVFTPDDTANFNSATQSTTLNVTVGGKTLPTVQWAMPFPILYGTPLGERQLNATADVQGTFTYSPPAGTILPAGHYLLSVLFQPYPVGAGLSYTSLVRTVTIDVALPTNNPLVRIAYIVPTNRVPQAQAVATLRKLLPVYQKFFADQLERNGFARKTFAYESEPDGVTPVVNVLPVPTSDTYLRGDLYGDRLLDTVRAAGLPIGSPGQIWWLIAESHVEHFDGTIGGGFAVGQQLSAVPVDSGWAITGGDDLALYQTLYQTNATPYDGCIVPELGSYPLVQDLSFPWFEGITLSGVSSSAVGTGLRCLAEAFGLQRDYRNDENFNGNLMGFGFRGLRGVLYPSLYPYNYCGLSYASALALSVNPFFSVRGQGQTNGAASLDVGPLDLSAPSVAIVTRGAVAPLDGLIEITFSASDDHGLHAALLSWQTESETVLVDEMSLGGSSAGVGGNGPLTNFTGTFRMPYFSSQQTNRYTITVFDKQGNRRSAQTALFPTATPNHSPQPFLRVRPVVVGPGEDVWLDVSDTFDPEHGSSLLEVEWDLDGDGVFDTPASTELVHVANYLTLGTRLIRARLTDPAGDVAVSAPVAVSVTTCLTTLSPTSRTNGYSGGYYTNKVTAGSKCHVAVVNTNDWITLPGGSEMVGSGELVYVVAENPLFTERRGNLLIGDQVFEVIQKPAACTYSVSPTNKFQGYGVGSGSFKVSTKTNCSWALVNTNTWITITSADHGTNTTTVTYAITENRTLGRRTGNIVVEGEVFSLTQWGTNCELVISPYWRTHSENSETGLVTVSTAGGCSWSVFNTNSWITITTPGSGSGSSNFVYSLAPNLGTAPRVGRLLINDQSLTITQQVCSFSVSPTRAEYDYQAESGGFMVSAGPSCSWSVLNPNPWIILTSPQSGTGTGAVTYYVGDNPRGSSRSGTLTVAGQHFDVVQRGKPCDYTIDPIEGSHGEEGELGEINVYADVGCEWSASSPVPWLTIVDPGPGEGNGAVLYVIDANTGPARSATLTVAGQDYGVSQASGIRLVTAPDMAIASDQTNHVDFILNAHGGENKLAFSVCFDTNLLSYAAAQLRSGAPLGLTLTVQTNQVNSGHIGLTVSLPTGFSLPAGTATVVQVSFRAAAINGKQTTVVSVCDTPVARRLVDAVDRSLSAAFGEATVLVVGFCSLSESLDTEISGGTPAIPINWTNGPIPWTCQTNITHDTEDAAQSGPTPDSGESYFETALTGPGLLTFWWKVSCEPNNDRLRFYMDTVQQFQITGEQDWEWRTFLVPFGPHTLRWRYNKNSSLAAGMDRGWVDQIVYAPAPPSITNQPTSLTVDSGTTASLSVVAGGQAPITYQWLFNDVAISDSANVRGTRTATLTLSNVQPFQAGAYSVVVGSPAGNITSSNAVLSVIPLVSLPEALDATSLVWSTPAAGSVVGWVGQPVVTHDGVDAARSGTITHSQTNAFQTTLTGPGTLSFWWKVSSEPSNDKLSFFINGSSQSSISGEVNWQQKTFNLGSGLQTLLWSYGKNSSVSAGQDRAWVDEVRFSPAPVSIATHPAGMLADQGGTATFSVSVAGAPPFSYQWRFTPSGGTPINIDGATASMLSVPNVQPENAGNYSVLVANATGSALSSNALLQINRLVPLPEAIDATNFVWVTNGSPPWVGQTAVTHDGVDAARSGKIADNGTTTFQTTVTGPGTVTFWWKCSTDGSDKLRFYIAGSQQESITGEIDWTFRSWPVSSSGPQLLEWRYTKGSSGAAGADAGWVDQIYFVPNNTAVLPTIAIQPTGRVAVAPTNVTFNALAVGSGPLSYQWLFGTGSAELGTRNWAVLTNGGGVSGATTTNLTLTAAGAAQSGDYALMVTNSAGCVTSAVATLTMIAAPVITNQPASQNVLAGSTANFGVRAVGLAPLTYQWRWFGTNLANVGNISGVTTTNLKISSVIAAQAGPYTVVVSNAAGSVTSAVAPLVISTAPTITSQPSNLTAVAGGPAVFSVAASGSAPLSFQWRFNGTNLTDGDDLGGSASATLVLSNVQPADAGNYSVVISNPVGSLVSSNALLSVLIPPSIVAQSPDQSVPETATVSLSVTAAGTAPLYYQWRRFGTNLLDGGSVSGATNSTLVLINAQPSQGGLYSVQVSNAVGTAVSSNILLSVLAPITLDEAVNAPYLVWNSDVHSPWTVQTNVTHDGEAAARSGAITNGGSSWIETTVTGPGTLRFWWKVSSQTNADWLTFSVGGAPLAAISGEVDWQKLSFNLPGGSVSLRWSFSKDATGTNGQDRAWLDEVDFVPTSGPSVPVIVSQPLGADVDPGTTVTLDVSALGTAPLSYQWRFEGQSLADSADVLGAKSPTLTLFNVQPSQAGLYDVLVRNPYSLAISDKVFVNVIPVISLPVALDTDRTNLVWITGGFSPWRGQIDFNSDRIDAAQSGPVPNSQSNWIQTIVSGPGAITFFWKVSSETNHDRLRFLVDGVELANISGEVDWRQRTFEVLQPNATLRWVYTKDGSGSAGLDRGWVDQVHFGPSAPIITNAGPEVSIVDQGTTVRLSVDAVGTPPFSYQWQVNGTNLVNGNTNAPRYPGFISGAIGSHRLTISNAQPWQSGLYACNVYNQGGVAVSAPMSLQVVPALPISQALNSNLVWETGGYSWWVGTTNITHDGFMAARNGTLPSSQATWLQTRVTGPGTLSFWWKSSTETNDDLKFYINDVEQARIAGILNWQQLTYDLNDIGSNYVFRWEYSKNGLFTNGLDQVYLDEVTFGPIPPVFLTQPASLLNADAGSTITFSGSARGTPPFEYQWLFNNDFIFPAGNVSGITTPTLRITNLQPLNAGRYSLAIINAAGFVISSNASLTVVPTFPLGEALEASNYIWSAGSPPWVGQPLVSHDGVDAARSPALGNSASSTMQATMAGPGVLSFWWKVSSETNKDLLTLYTNGTEAAHISGEVDWQQRSFNLPAGNTLVKWTYSKNGSVVAGQDRGWVDEVVLLGMPPSITTHPVATNVDQGTVATFTVVSGGTPPFSYQWRRDGVDLVNAGQISGANSAVLTISNVQPFHVGEYSVFVANSAGGALSAGAALTVTRTLALAAALDTTNLVWSTTGLPSWVGQYDVSHDFEDAARVAAVPDSGSVSMQATVFGPGALSFWWKVSSETNNDRLTFSTNGTEALRISGDVDWQYKTINIGSGSQTLKWTYSKNSSVAGGLDRAWVDQVSFLPTPVNVTLQPVSQVVDVGATASFNVTLGGAPPFVYQWQFNGVDLANGPNVSGATSSNLVLANVQLAQAGTYRVVASGAAGSAVSAGATLSVYPVLTLAVGLDAPAFVWTTNGTPPWTGNGAVSHDGVDAARSGAIGHGTNTSMGTIVTGPGTGGFWWKVSSETNKDFLFFYTNGVEAARISGEVDWQFKSFNLGVGTQALLWVYSKSSSGVAGQDRGWVDEFTFAPVRPSVVSQPASQGADAGGSASFGVDVAGTPPFSYQWQFNGADLVNDASVSGVTSSNLVLNNVQLEQAGSYRCLITGYTGAVVSAAATLTVFPLLSLEQALDAPGLAWTTNPPSAAPWAGSSLFSHDGLHSARSGVLGNNASNTFGTSLAGPAGVTFWWKVSSETNNDRLTFFTNGVEAAHISGEVDWQFKSFNLSSGTQALLWVYSKNSSGAAGQDRAWVDQVFYGPLPPSFVAQPTNFSADVGATASFSANVSGTPPFAYQWQYNGVDLTEDATFSGTTSPTLVLNNVQLAHAGTYRVVVSGTGGTAASAGALLKVWPILSLEEALDFTNNCGLPAADCRFQSPLPGDQSGTPSGGPPSEIGLRWVGHGALSHDGVDAARAPAIGHNSTNSFGALLAGPGTLAFWWKVSCETNNDKLLLLTNGVEAARISGEVDWQLRTFNLPPGPQSVQWSYAKNASVSAGRDRGWVDQVQFGVLPPIITGQPTNLVIGAGSNAVFRVSVGGTPPMDYRWLYNGDPLPNGSGVSGVYSDTLTLSGVQGGRAGTYSVVVSNSAGVATSAAASLSVLPSSGGGSVSLAQALDGPGLTYSVGGSGPAWFGQQAVSYDTQDAAQSGACTDSTYTYMKATVTGPGPLSFYWKVSSELDHDYLRFIVDGVDQLRISGEVDWQQVLFTVTNGTHELQWRYSKNSSITVGQDHGWVDQVYYGVTPPALFDPPVILRQPAGVSADAGETVTLSVNAASSYPMTYRWYYTDGLNGPVALQNGPTVFAGSVSGATNANLTLVNIDTAQSGDYWVVVSNQGGPVTSAAAHVAVNPTAPRILIQPVGQTVEEGATVNFSVSVSSALPVTYRWFRNGTNLLQNGLNVGGANTAQLILWNVGSAQAGNYSVVVSNSVGAVASAAARLTINRFADLADALDTLDLFILTDGHQPWLGQTVVTHDGVDAARSGPILDGQYSRLQTHVDGPGTVSFWWKVSSEINADVLSFSLNGAQQESISGEVDWQRIQVRVFAGPQALDWVYQKNGSGAAGMDRGWVDQLTYVPDHAAGDGNTNTPLGSMSLRLSIVDKTAQVSWQGRSDKIYRVFYKDSLDDLEWTLLDGEVLLTWQVVDGTIVPDVVLATFVDVLAGQTRFYKVLEY